MGNRYWLENPADNWEEALPLGNGRLGASVWGNVENDRVTINEEGMWYGKERSRQNRQSQQYVGKIRELLMGGRVEEAQFLCQMAMTSTPKYIRPYQMACDLNFLFLHKENTGQGRQVRAYRRQLDIDHAVADISYAIGESSYTRKYFISAEYQVLVMKLTARGQGKLSFQFNINRRPFEQYSGGDGKEMIFLKGQCGDGVTYHSAALMGEHDGQACQIGDYLAVTDATQAVIYFDCETSFTGREPEKVCMERLRRAKENGYERLLQTHEEDYGKLYGKMSLTLQEEDYSEIPMNRLLKRVQETGVRSYLTQLLFAFGRYLMIGSSWQCSLPATLQGIWNGSFTPRWESKYTININLEMNYWMVDSCGLSECFAPFESLLKRIVENGRETAAKIYGCGGSVAHHNTDCYGNSDLEGLPASAFMWPMGEAWLSLNLYDHYRYGCDMEYLKSVVLPVLEENIRFFHDFLYRRKDGLWLCGPSVSPENTYQTKDGQRASITMAPTMDNQILWELCSNYMEGCSIAGRTGEVLEMAGEILEHLPPMALTEDGRIREWLEDYDETEKGHRHISHLFGLYPGNQITQKQPRLMEAARKTLRVRLENGGGHTGWSRAWLICMFARLGEADSVSENIRLFLENSVKENLYDSHPPFQIDGNFGLCAGIVEALAQKQEQHIYLLPAAPEEWTSGKVHGLRLKDGFILDMIWNESRLSYCLTAAVPHQGRSITLHYGRESHVCVMKADGKAEGAFSTV